MPRRGLWNEGTCDPEFLVRHRRGFWPPAGIGGTGLGSLPSMNLRPPDCDPGFPWGFEGAGSAPGRWGGKLEGRTPPGRAEKREQEMSGAGGSPWGESPATTCPCTCLWSLKGARSKTIRHSAWRCPLSCPLFWSHAPPFPSVPQNCHPPQISSFVTTHHRELYLPHLPVPDPCHSR